MEHIPVMLNEVMECLAPKKSGIYVDCTFGAGGYSTAILNSVPVTLYAFDQDPDVLPFAEKLKNNSSAESTFYFIQDNFANIEEVLKSKNISHVDGIVLDLGISSIQVDRAERGFSFQKEGKLDMRMSQEGYSAYDFVNEADEQTLSRIIYLYGDEQKARKIARSIVEKRKVAPIETTTQLANIVREVCFDKRLEHKRKIDSSTKTFQAIRIYVNKEIEALEKVLDAAERLLGDNGHLVVVSFHSLEDRVVKNFLAQRSKANHGSRYFGGLSKEEEFKPIFKLLTKKPLVPTAKEIESNLRSRSAKLRAAVKINGENYDN
jgi:16S rRNA (cytosine1402-N4)-methyltransferase